jgi:hypothetical protein
MSTGTPEPRISTTPQPFLAASDPVLDSALLNAKDLGTGWSKQSMEGATAADAYYCGVKVESRPASAAVTLWNGATGYNLVEAVTRFADAAVAAASLRETRTAHAGCSNWISTDGVRRTLWHTESFHRIDMGDEAIAEHATDELTGSTGPSTVYAYTIRAKDVIIEVAVFVVGATNTLDVDRAGTDTADLAQRAYDKLHYVLWTSP